MVEGLLRDFVQEDWLALIDFTTLEKQGGSYVSDDLREREDDIIWRVRVAGDWLYVYLLFEFQSQVDPWMAVRVVVYTGLLYQDLIKSQAVTAGERLPPVFPRVLYNGSGRWTAARDVAELIAPLPDALARGLGHRSGETCSCGNPSRPRGRSYAGRSGPQAATNVRGVARTAIKAVALKGDLHGSIGWAWTATTS